MSSVGRRAATAIKPSLEVLEQRALLSDIEPNDTLATAVDTGLTASSPGTYVITGSVSRNMAPPGIASDPRDFYKFSTGTNATFRANIIDTTQPKTYSVLLEMKIYENGVHIKQGYTYGGNTNLPAFNARANATYHVEISSRTLPYATPAIESYQLTITTTGESPSPVDIEMVSAELVDPKTVGFSYRTTGDPGAFQVGLFRSRDEQYDASDSEYQVGDLLTVEPSSELKFDGFLLNEPVPSDRPYLLIVAFPGEGIDEEDATNNVAATLRTGLIWKNRGRPGDDCDGFEQHYDAAAEAARRLVDRAIWDWNAVIRDFNYSNVGQPGYAPLANTFALEISADQLMSEHGNEQLGRVTGILPDPDGKPIAAVINLDDNGAGSDWYIEGASNSVIDFSTLLSPFKALGLGSNYDLFSTITHEIGHAVGIVLNSNMLLYKLSRNVASDPNEAGESLLAFDATSPSITLTTAGNGHFYEGARRTNEEPTGVSTHPHELMNEGRALGNQISRRIISDLSARVLRDAYGYSIPAMPSELGMYFSGPLYVVGPHSDTADDTIRIDGTPTGEVIVTLNGSEIVFPSGSVGRVTAFGGGGNDRIDALTFPRRIRIFGNDGNDFLRGGRRDDDIEGGAGNDILIGMRGNDFLDGGDGHDLLVGREGNDTLRGRRGRDLLIGGDGTDHLYGGGGGDILIGSATQQDPLFDELKLILDEWTSARTYRRRVADLRSKLVLLDDGVEDELFGEGGRDWFLTADSSEVKDRGEDEEIG